MSYQETGGGVDHILMGRHSFFDDICDEISAIDVLKMSKKPL